jgi:hypothetical protein
MDAPADPSHGLEELGYSALFGVTDRPTRLLAEPVLPLLRTRWAIRDSVVVGEIKGVGTLILVK